MRHFIATLNCILIPISAEASPIYEFVDLATLGGTTSYSQAWGINNRGRVVGQASTCNGDGWYHAVLFSGTGSGNIDLGTLGGGFASVADSINDSGTIVGGSFFWESGQLSALTDVVGGIPNGWFSLRVLNKGGDKINDWGQIAATVFVPGQGDPPACWASALRWPSVTGRKRGHGSSGKSPGDSVRTLEIRSSDRYQDWNKVHSFIESFGRAAEVTVSPPL